MTSTPTRSGASRSRLWGFRGEIAEDGVRALELIRSFDPHILLSDLRMPRKGGLELLHDIRELGIHLPTIMISGQGEIPDAVEALKQGAIDYMRKPVDPTHLQRVLKNIADNINIREENSYAAPAPGRGRRAGAAVRAVAADAQSDHGDRAAGAVVGVGGDNRRERHRQGAGGAHDS